ncbi:MAG: hypothetical protein ACT6RQ_20675, partial [Hydrogenophaga sp.]|uniref:hypothetical protein n=1 Tax=Hydrogenophaga sp. TaxID=1904254 RepID=UPI0040366849
MMMNLRFSLRAVLVPAVLSAIVLATPPAPARAADDPLAAARSEFAAALAAVDAGTLDGVDSDRLRAYPLHPYLLAARLRLRLARLAAVDDSSTDEAVAAFLKANGDAPVTRELRRAWLNSLASRQQWPAYLANLPASMAAADSVLRCQQLAARIALNQTDGLGPLVIEQWQAADRSLPACDAAFDWAKGQQLLTPALIEARARRVAGNGYGALAKVIATPLAADARARISQWAALIDAPQKALDALIADPARPVDDEALLDGWQRHARKDPEAAAARFAALREARRLDDAAASRYARALALGLAWSRKPAALDWFAKTLPADVDVVTAEWWARAALWSGDWPQVTRAIALLPEASRSEQRWRYWSARAAAAGGDEAAKAQLA